MPSGQYNVVELSSTSAAIAISTSAAITVSATATSTSAVITSVAATTTAGVLVAVNTGRKGLLVQNDPASVSSALLSYTTVAGSTNYSVVVPKAAYWEMPVPLYAGAMAVAISTTTTGGTATIIITELT